MVIALPSNRLWLDVRTGWLSREHSRHAACIALAETEDVDGGNALVHL